MSQTTSFSRYADYYDFLYADKNYEAECLLLDAMSREHSRRRVATVLDIGCGTGGHLLPLTSRGWALTGLDLSDTMLEHARRKTLGADPPVHLVQGDARSFDLGKRFDMVISMFAAMCYVTDNAGLAAALQAVTRHLEPGGIFFMDFWYGPAVLNLKPEPRVLRRRADGREVIRLASPVLDSRSHTVSLRYDVWAMAEDMVTDRISEDHRVRFLFPLEIEYQLQQAGLELLRLGAFPDLGRQATDSDWNAFLVARAP
jgi:SAM-dependent methyltransferase